MGARTKLSQAFIKASSPGKYNDGGGLWLHKRAGIEARPHGFRSTLRRWIAETQNLSLEVAEMVLAHRPASKVVRANERTDFLDQRREIMGKWAAYLLG